MNTLEAEISGPIESYNPLPGFQTWANPQTQNPLVGEPRSPEEEPCNTMATVYSSDSPSSSIKVHMAIYSGRHTLTKGII